VDRFRRAGAEEEDGSSQAAWTAQQLREAFPWDKAPRYLIQDRDHAFDSLQATAKAMGIEEVLTAPRAPWQNPFVEQRSSARRECFDHVIVFNEAGLKRLMTLNLFVLRTVPHALVAGQRYADSSSGHAAW
jgi:hypothetical protein